MIAVHRRAGSRGSVSVAASGVAAASIRRTRSGARAASVASGGWPGAASVGVEVGVDSLPMSSLPSRARPPSGGSQTAPPLPERQRAPAAEPGHCRRILYRSCLDPELSLIHISEPTRLLSISYAVFCLKKKKTHTKQRDNNIELYKPNKRTINKR